MAYLLGADGSLTVVGDLLSVVAAGIGVLAGSGSRGPSLGSSSTGRPSSLVATGRPALSSSSVSGSGELRQKVESGSTSTDQLLGSQASGEHERDLGDNQSLGGQQDEASQEDGDEGNQLSADGQGDGSHHLLHLATACGSKEREKRRLSKPHKFCRLELQRLPSSIERAKLAVISLGNLTSRLCEDMKLEAASRVASNSLTVFSSRFSPTISLSVKDLAVLAAGALESLWDANESVSALQRLSEVRDVLPDEGDTGQQFQALGTSSTVDGVDSLEGEAGHFVVAVGAIGDHFGGEVEQAVSRVDLIIHNARRRRTEGHQR